MDKDAAPFLSVPTLFAERERQKRREREAEEQLKMKHDEELSAFKNRLDEFQLTDAHIEALAVRVKAAFEHGETELLLTSFPSSFCTDNGRAVNNADVPPTNKPGEQEGSKPREPEWLATLPRGARPVYEYWEQHLKPGGFGFSARVINYPGGIPGDIGLFLSWPKSTPEELQ